MTEERGRQRYCPHHFIGKCVLCGYNPWKKAKTNAAPQRGDGRTGKAADEAVAVAAPLDTTVREER